MGPPKTLHGSHALFAQREKKWSAHGSELKVRCAWQGGARGNGGTSQHGPTCHECERVFSGIKEKLPLHTFDHHDPFISADFGADLSEKGAHGRRCVSFETGTR